MSLNRLHTLPAAAASVIPALRRAGMWFAAHPALGLLHLAAFCMPFSLPLGRLGMASALVALVVERLRGRRRMTMPVTGWAWLLFVVLACVVTAVGVNPAVGCRKLDKLIWLLGIPVAATAVRGRRDAMTLVRSLALGCLALAVWLCLRNPAVGWWQVRQGLQPDLETALIDLGALDDGQRLMIGVIAALGLWLAEWQAGRRRNAWLWAGAVAILAVAEGLALKRGSWIVTALVAGGMLAMGWGWWRSLLLGLGVVGLLLAFEPARNRLRDLPNEVQGKRGGRMTMWTQIAPGLRRDYPWGVGFRSLSNDLMRQYAPDVEQERDHLHSNPIQVFVALGWPGLVLYLAWMGWALRDTVRFARAGPTGKESARWWNQPAARWLLLALLLALILNGLIEYNLADGEIMLLYGLLMGLAAAAGGDLKAA